MTRIFGAQHDLQKKISTHLFVLCPNNSGSTFVSRALGTCRSTWSLPREGQATFGFAGPRSQAMQGQALSWAAHPEVRAQFEDAAAYDWEKTRRAWYFAATAAHEAACVFVSKSPPHLLIADQLAQKFPNTRFVIMVRNPYATIEGIFRNKKWPDLSRAQKLELAARHVRVCLERQAANRDTFAAQSVFFRYEDMCADPLATAAQVRDLVPELDDLNFDQSLPVKTRYFEPLRDMNADQIARLTEEDLRVINRVLLPVEAIVEGFGYQGLCA